jgi:putative ABC transport system permease protein
MKPARPAFVYTPQGNRMESFLNDLKHSLRTLRQNPGFTITAVSALALGIGASTAIFSVVNAVLLRPMPYPDPERLVIFLTTHGGGGTIAFPAKFNVWREQGRLFQNVSAFKFGAFNLTGGSYPEQIRSGQVSADFFRLFGVPIVQGRTFSREEDLPRGSRVVVLSQGLWMRRFGGDRAAIGKTISLSGEPYQVIGILGPAFDSQRFSDGWQQARAADVWVPFQIDPHSREDNEYFTVAGRLKPGVTLDMAKAELQLVAEQFRQKFPGDITMGPHNGFGIHSMQDALVSDVRKQLQFLASAVGFVLLIACANVTNLLLIRATGRKREIAIRSALGAGRGRIIRQLLTESVMLSMGGGALGLILGMVSIRALLAINPGDIPRIGEHGSAVSADWRVLSFTLLASFATGLLFGVLPALQASRADLSAALKESGGRSRADFHQSRARSLLVVSEVTLAVILLVGAGLLIHTLIALRSVNPGFDAHNVLTMQMSLTGPRFQKASGVADLVRDSLQRISALPGVMSAAYTYCLPVGGEAPYGSVFIVGRPLNATSHDSVRVATISPGYFDVFKIPLLRGRAFTDRDDIGATPVAVINDALARRFWARGNTRSDPLKDLLTFEDIPRLPPRHIIGIVDNVHDEGLTRDPPLTVYFPVPQTPDGLNTYIQRTPIDFVVRTRRETHSLSSAIQRELIQTSGGLPVASINSMDEILAQSTARQNFSMLLLSIFASAALLLAAIGIYGLMAHSVQQRTQEIGIRLALGAESQNVRNMVVFQGMRLALVGVAIGVLAAFGMTRLLASFLFGIKTSDPIVFMTVPVLLSGVALFAVWFPARRASRINPIDALRHE